MMKILMIMALQLVYVPTFTMRTIFLVRGKAALAAALGFVETLIYVFGLSIVFSGKQDVIAMVVYALGFGIGILIGTAIERKLAIGYTTIQVNVESKDPDVLHKLRDSGFGVTVYEGEGRDTKRFKLEILTKRSRQGELMEMIEKHVPNAFVIAYEPTQFRGGFLVKNMKRSKK